MSVQIQARCRQFLVAVIILGLLPIFAFTSISKSAADAPPIEISSQEQLMAIDADAQALGLSYILKNDIILNQTKPSSGYYIGDGGILTNFTGNFDGGNHTISNLLVPLFQEVGKSGMPTSVSHLNLSTIATGFEEGFTGILTEELIEDTTIDDVHVSGKLLQSVEAAIGGIAGRASVRSLIKNSSADVTIILCATNDDAGGLVGSTAGSIENSFAKVSISGQAYGNVGGLVGTAESGSTITRSASSGTIIGEGDYENSAFGGLVGLSTAATIDSSYSSVTISTMQDSYVGGLIAIAREKPVSGDEFLPTRILNSYATGNVSNRGYNAGGLVGKIEKGEVSNCVAEGNVSGRQYVGGLIGYSESTPIRISSARGRVSGSSFIGGLAGYFSTTIPSTIETSTAFGSVDFTGTNPRNVGSLIGYVDNEATLLNVSATGTVSGVAPADSNRTSIGGLIGFLEYGATPPVNASGVFRSVLEDLNTFEGRGTPNLLPWALSLGVNSARPHIKALLGRGFYETSVTFDANGGLGNMDLQIGTGLSPLTPNTFTRTGYTFEGWALSTNGPLAYRDERNYHFQNNLRLYALWTAITTSPPIVTYIPPPPLIVTYIPPPPQSYLTVGVAPSLHKIGNLAVCSSGTYNYGVTYFDGTPNSLTKNVPLTAFLYRFFIDGLENKDLAFYSAEASISVPISKLPKKGLLTCQVSVEYGGVVHVSSSILNNVGVEAADLQRKNEIYRANINYQATLRANIFLKSDAINANRKQWRESVNLARSQFASIKAVAKSPKEVVAASKVQSLAVAKAATTYKFGKSLIESDYLRMKVLAEEMQRDIQKDLDWKYIKVLEANGYGVSLESNS